MFTQDERERAAYEHRLKVQRDHGSYLQDARERGFDEGMRKGEEKGIEKGMEKGIEKGMEKGMEKGIEKGMEKGTLIGEIRASQGFLKLPRTPDAKLAAMSLEELNILLTQLREQLSSPV